MPFNLYIDIGSEEQKELIEREFRLLLVHFESKYNLSEKIVNVYFPVDFQLKVRELSGTENYTSLREDNLELAVAKTLYGKTFDILVISPELFTDSQDTNTRAYVYFHELAHISDGDYRMPLMPYTKENALTSDINSIFTEYRADCISFDLIHDLYEIIPDSLVQLYNSNMTQFYEKLRQEAQYQLRLRQIIHDFKYRKISFDDFNLKSFQIIKSFLISISHLFAHLHSNIPEINQEKEQIASSLQDIDLLDEDIFRLTDLFRDQHSKKNKRIASDLVNVLDSVYQSLGIFIEDTPEGLYIGVNFI